MKRLFLVVAAAFLLCTTTFAQHNLRTGYFLDGYTYKHKLNPAFGGDRGYFAIPVAGYVSAGVESNLALSTLLYPTGDGTLTTFLSPSVKAEDFLSKIKDNNPFDMNADIGIVSLGFNAGKSYNTIDLSLKADARMNVPGSLFSWAKKYGSHLDMTSLGLNANARLELSYGYSRSIGEKIRVGAKVKLLAGLARAEYQMDKLTVDMEADKWRAEAQGTGYFASPAMKLLTSDGVISGVEFAEVDEIQTILNSAMNAGNFGAALDLGISVDVLKCLTVSASLTDIGFINWRGTSLGSDSSTWEYTGVDNIGAEGNDIGQQLEGLGNELLDIISPKVIADDVRFNDLLSMTAHVGVEFRMPFWQRLSVGALGTYRFDGPYSWWEARGSVNLALARWFSLTGNFAYSTFGDSFGAAINFHPNGINLFIGVDSFKPALDVTPQFVPIHSFNTNLAVGLNLAFGKYHGRFPKKPKAAPEADK